LGRPTGYDPAKEYPLVIFLHGSGESGTDNKLQVSKHMGVPQGGSVFTLPANQAAYPTFFVAPQAPAPGVMGWMGVPGAAVLKLIAYLEQHFSIDPARIYVTGLSMGAFGTWWLIENNPMLFAAAVPMSGGGDTTKAAAIAQLPIWDFHGTLDPSVTVAQSRQMIAALIAAGGHPKYTEYPNGLHDIWDTAYTEPALLPWMFTQHRPFASNLDAGAADAAVAEDASTSDAPPPSADAISAADAEVDAENPPDSSALGVSPSDAGTGSDSSSSAPATDGASVPASDAPSTNGAGNGCACAVPRGGSAAWPAIVAGCAVFAARRRRRV
jgi:predicted esterase